MLQCTRLCFFCVTLVTAGAQHHTIKRTSVFQEFPKFPRSMCQWHVSISATESPYIQVDSFLSDRTVISVAEEMKDLDIKTLTDEMKSAFYYFLRVQVECAGKVDPVVARGLAFEGYIPEIEVQNVVATPFAPEEGVQIFRLHGALVDLSRSKASAYYPCPYYLCEPAWLIPVPVSKNPFFRVRVLSSGTVIGVQKIFYTDSYKSRKTGKSFLGTSHVDYIRSMFHENGTDTDKRIGFYPFNLVFRSCATVIFAGFHGLSDSGNKYGDVVISADPDFEKHMSIKMEIHKPVVSESVCGHGVAPTVIKSVVSMEDRLILNTYGGLVEVYGYNNKNVGSGREETAVLSLPRCIKSLHVSGQAPVWGSSVIALADKRNNREIFIAEEKKGSYPLDFRVLKENGRGICDQCHVIGPAFMDTNCTVKSAAVNPMEPRAYMFLVYVERSTMRMKDECKKGDYVTQMCPRNTEGQGKHKIYFLVEYKGGPEDGKFQVVNAIPAMLCPDVTLEFFMLLPGFIQKNCHTPANLKHITFVRYIFPHLFVYGKTLIQSSNVGRTLMLLTKYNSQQQIQILETSHAGHFAFLTGSTESTENRELWAGVIGEHALEKIQPSSGWAVTHSLLGGVWKMKPVSVSFTLAGELFEVVILEDDNGTTRLERLIVPLGSIARNAHFWQKMKNLHTEGKKSLPAPVKLCPYDALEFHLMKWQTVTRSQLFELFPPRLNMEHLHIHNTSSLLVYQAVAYFIMKHSLALQDEAVHASTHIDPIIGWKISQEEENLAYKFLFNIGLVNEGIHVDLSDYSKVYDRGVGVYNTLPTVMYIDKYGYINFKLELFLDTVHSVGKRDPRQQDLGSILVNFENSNATVLSVTISRTESIVAGSVTYSINIQENGIARRQSPTGLNLQPVTLVLHVWGAGMMCSRTHTSGSKVDGPFVTTVMVGCPPSLSLVFDWNATVAAVKLRDKGEHYDCRDNTKKERPCFYFLNNFHPFFLLVDKATGVSQRFTGKYTLNVIAGGEIRKRIKNFSLAEIVDFNHQAVDIRNKHTRIWQVIDTNVDDSDVPVFTHENNSIKWICERNSPCADIYPRFPVAPTYWLTLEVSNREVDTSTHCDFTTRVTIKLHSLSVTPFSRVMMIMVMLGFCAFALGIYCGCMWRNLKLKAE